MEQGLEDILRSMYRDKGEDIIILKKGGKYTGDVVLGRSVLKQSSVFKHTILSKDEFASLHNIHGNAVNYLIQKELLNYILIDGEVFIIMDELGSSYVANKSSKRGNLGAKIDRI